ncbi:MAG TPA: hypothetical protein VGD84_18485 [Pseudonocardiaceae bacterium]
MPPIVLGLRHARGVTQDALARLSGELMEGRGFALLRGVPVVGLTEHELK